MVSTLTRASTPNGLSWLRRAIVPAGLVAVLAVTGCTATTATTTSTTPTSAADGAQSDTGILPGYRDESTLMFSPLIITALASEVVPVKGSDGKYYVAYELSVFNDAPRDATLTSIETLAGDETGAVINTVNQDQLAPNTMLTASDSRGTTTIPAGRTAIVVLRDTYPALADVPKTFTHRLGATFAPPAPDAPRLASKFPDSVEQIGAALTTSTATPLIIGPPVTGDNWFANNGLQSDTLNAHSDVVIPVGGRVTSAERYAIDFMGIDPATMKSYRGDSTQNSSYLAFDQPLIAVADATVVRVISDQPDVTPLALADLKIIDDATGNQVVLDLGNGVFALYAHMKQASALVKVGDTVKKGQEIGRLGNSGNTSEAHLHFQLQRSPLLSGENVPWVIDGFTSIGVLAADGDSVIDAPRPGKQSNEVPVANSVSGFPALAG
jgi:hypothetical protein